MAVPRFRIFVLLGVMLVLTAGPDLAGRCVSLQVEVGLQAPPLRFPSLVASVAGDGPYRLEVGLTHQRAVIRSATRISLLGLMALAPEQRAGLALTPILGAGVEIGRITVGVHGSESTTPMATVKLVAGAEHALEGRPLIVLGRVWHAIGLQPRGLGYGAALGVRLPFQVRR